MTVRRALTRTWAAAALLLLAGCGGNTDGTAAPSTPPSSAPSTPDSAAPSTPDSTAPPETSAPASPGGTSQSGTAGVARCATADLAGALRAQDSGAGQRYATIVLTNRGPTTCRIDGYGGVGLVGADGRVLPTKQDRDPSTPGVPVDLRPGAAASSQLHWTVVPSTGDAATGNCQPVPATLNVIPPDEHTAVQIPWTFGPVCGGGRFEQRAYRAGEGR
jgi:hypothetical protein